MANEPVREEVVFLGLELCKQAAPTSVPVPTFQEERSMNIAEIRKQIRRIEKDLAAAIVALECDTGVQVKGITLYVVPERRPRLESVQLEVML